MTIVVRQTFSKGDHGQFEGLDELHANCFHFAEGLYA